MDTYVLPHMLLVFFPNILPVDALEIYCLLSYTISFK